MSKGLVTSGGRGQGTRTPLNDRVGEGGGGWFVLSAKISKLTLSSVKLGFLIGGY